MMVEQAILAVEKIKELYPAWKPSTTEIEALRHKLGSFLFEDAKTAWEETWSPAKRTAPVEAIFAECRRMVSARQKAECRRQDAAVGPLCTKEEADAIWAARASEGNTFAMMWCDKHNIPYEAKEAIPF